MISQNAELLWWSAALIFGVPLAVVILGEASLRLAARDSKYQRFIELTRTVLLPSVIVVIVVRAVLVLDEERMASRAALTVLLISITYVGFVFFRNLAAEKRPERWENRIPSLFKIMLRIAVVVVPMIVLADTWGVDLSGNLGALGIGGIAIAFALQDAIGNVVSGVLLILDRPFSVGDWIDVDGLHGEVVDISWRSTRVRVDSDVVILPNITLSNSSIRNLTALDPLHEAYVDFAFASDDRPATVKEMLEGVAADNDEISKVEPPEVHLHEFGDSSVTYRLHYNIDSYVSDFHAAQIKEQLRTTVFHAHTRYGLTMPYPTVMHLDRDALNADVGADDLAALEFLRWNSVFASLPDEVLERLAREVRHESYATGETILSPGSSNRSVYLVLSGDAQLVADQSNRPNASVASDQHLALQTGDVFGEDAMVSQLGGEWHACAVSDVELYVFDAAVISTVAEQHPKLAAAMNRLLIERERYLRQLRVDVDLTESTAAPVDQAGDD